MKPKSKKPAKVAFSRLKTDKQIRLIQEALKESVFPMLASHGGGVEIMDINGWKIYIQYFGACYGCPLAGTGTLNFIQSVLQEKIDKRIEVLPV